MLKYADGRLEYNGIVALANGVGAEGVVTFETPFKRRLQNSNVGSFIVSLQSFQISDYGGTPILKASESNINQIKVFCVGGIPDGTVGVLYRVTGFWK